MSDNPHHSDNGSTPVYQTEQLIQLFERSDTQIQKLYEYATADFLAVNAYMRPLYACANTIWEQVSKPVAGAFKEEIQEYAHDSTKRISDIIMRMQYHDIIRQKLENIRRANQVIIEELQQNHPAKEEKLIYCHRICRDVAQLHSAQLQSTGTVCEEALTEIRINLFAVRHNAMQLMNESSMSVTINHESLAKKLQELIQETDTAISQIKHTDLFEITVKELVAHLEELYQALSMNIPLSDERAGIIAHLEQFYTMQSERIIYQQVFDIPSDKKPKRGKKGTDDTIEFF